jgi:hypothetical protein
MIIEGEDFLDPPNVTKLRFYSVLAFHLPGGIDPMVYEQSFKARDAPNIVIKTHPSRMFFYCMYVWEAD